MEEPYFFVYTGKNNSGQHVYLAFASEEAYKQGKTDAGFNCHYSSKLFKRGGIGSIFPVSYDKEARNVSYKDTADAVAYWSNSNDLIEWRATTKAYDLSQQAAKDNAEVTYTKILAPIRDAYRQLSRDKKTLLLAEIIRVITS